LGALRTFIDGLQGLQSVQANHLKTKGSLVLLVDGDTGRSTRCPGERFRAELAQLPPVERAAWQRLVLSMGTAMGPRPPKGFDQQARALSAFLGVAQTLARLERWLPTSESGPCALETAGSHLLRNFVWLLLFISGDARAARSCDPLVDRLVRVDFRPPQRGKKVAVACAVYFSRRPPAVGRKPLERLLARTMAMEKGNYDSDGIRKIVEGYRVRTMP